MYLGSYLGMQEDSPLGGGTEGAIYLCRDAGPYINGWLLSSLDLHLCDAGGRIPIDSAVVLAGGLPVFPDVLRHARTLGLGDVPVELAELDRLAGLESLEGLDEIIVVGGLAASWGDSDLGDGDHFEHIYFPFT